MEAGSQQAPWEGDHAPGSSPSSGDGDTSGGPGAAVVDEFAERPELFVGAAFAGGFAIAQILKRLTS